jgi:hypothetical protein
VFKAHILVNGETDAVGELASLEQAARKHKLSEAQIAIMMGAAGSVLTELQHAYAEMIASGIGMDAKKSVKSDGYDVTLEMRNRPGGSKKKPSPFGWILGR